MIEELITKFNALNKEEKIEFMKAIMPEMCKEFRDDSKSMMNDLMPICKEMMGNCNMDMRKMMSMMQK